MPLDPSVAPHTPKHRASERHAVVPARVEPEAAPVLPTRRPRPGAAAPHTAAEVAGSVRVGEETIPLPGLLAALRRNPMHARRASAAAIAAGVALFLTAMLTTPLAGADARTGTPVHPSGQGMEMPAPTNDLALGAAVPAVRKTLPRNPVHVADPAPANHGVISGLAANGIPNVALNAYRVAAARMANVSPSCGIDWALLAGIGREESDHGRFGGAVLHADGTSTPRIIGPALDGIHWDYIPAPGNGLALDGDARYAHALGPMQFIPSTWAAYGADANGDGKADIFNINDAALGTARYLCAAGGNLRTHAGQVAAVLTYNHSDQYLAQVLALADAYRRGVPITGIPLGITTGPLPKIANTGYIPPANPGAPTAVQKKRSTAAHPSASKSASSSSPRRAPKPSTSSASGSQPTAAQPTSAGSTATHSSAPVLLPGKSSSATSSSPAAPSSSTTCSPLQVALHLCH